MNKVKVLIVEDYPEVSAIIEKGLKQYNYEVTGIIRKGEEVIAHVLKEKPDIILMDINLAGKMNGVEAAKQIRSCSDTLIIYLTDITDDNIFKKAREAFPTNYLTKPFDAFETNRAIELAIYNFNLFNEKKPITANVLFGDFLFLKQKTGNYKLETQKIWWIEANKPNSKIKTEIGEFLVKQNMKEVSELLDPKKFIQIHQSFIVNIDKMKLYTNTEIIMVDDSKIPFGGRYKKNFKELNLTVL